MKPTPRFFIFGIIISAFLISPAATAREMSKSTFNNIMFSDVDKTHKNFNAIYFLYNTDVINGYKHEKTVEFKPDNKINRAEFLKLMMEGSKKSNHQEYTKCFKDVNTGEWYSTYICQAKEEGIINGYADGSFRPDQTITEVEALKILGKLLDWKVEENKTEQWYKPYVDFADQRQLLTDKNKENEKMTRGDMAEIIFRNTEVEELKTDKFEEKLVDDIFYNHDIPYGGPLGPGGILGPGGAFGKTGAFDSSAYFAGDNGEFKLIDEDFYSKHSCYYSDKGDFQNQVEEILKFISGNKTEDIKLAGYDMDGFGVMFCYSGIAATDLELFTKELRDQYEVKCWFDPMSFKETKGSYQRLLCYSEPGKPKWLTEDSYCTEKINEEGKFCTTCYKDAITKEVVSNQCREVKNSVKGAKELESGKSLYIEIKGNNEITAGSSGSQVEFFLTDNEGSPIINRNLKLVATTGIDYSKEFEVKEMGGGIYRTTFAPKLAGLYVLTVIDEKSGTKNDVTLRVNPGSIDHIQVVDRLDPNQSSAPNKASVRVVSKDKYDNTIPYSSIDNNLTGITTLGKLEVNHYNNIFNFDLEVDDWGIAEINFMLNGNIIGNKVKFDFFPIQIDMQKGISIEDKQVQAPVYVYFPSKYGKIGSYDFKIKYNLKGLKFKGLIDFDDKDKVTMPLFDVQNGFIHVWQPKTEVNSENPTILPIGTMLFDVTSFGDNTIYATDAILKDNEGHTVSGEISGFSDGLWGGTHVVKPTKNICLQAFVLPLPPGTGGAPIVAVTPAATEAEIAADVTQANAIFKGIAQSCNCNFYLNFTLKTPVTNLSYPELDALDSNHNGIVESDGRPNDANPDEIDKMMANHPTTPDCIPIYYVPQVNSGGGDSLLGLSRSSIRSNGIIINNGLDHDGRTLGHEMSHQLSHGEVDDPDGADAHVEGADQAGNLMNYDNTGDNLTPKQCEEIGKKLP